MEEESCSKRHSQGAKGGSKDKNALCQVSSSLPSPARSHLLTGPQLLNTSMPKASEEYSAPMIQSLSICIRIVWGVLNLNHDIDLLQCLPKDKPVLLGSHLPTYSSEIVYLAHKLTRSRAKDSNSTANGLLSLSSLLSIKVNSGEGTIKTEDLFKICIRDPGIVSIELRQKAVMLSGKVTLYE